MMRKWMVLAALVGGALGVTTAQAAVLNYIATLSGAAENPPNASAGTGFASVDWDTVARTMHLIVDFSGLTGTVTAAHIHCCVAPPGNVGVATRTPTFLDFPSGVTAGSYDHTYDMTDPGSWNPGFITNNGGTVGSAEAALFAGLAQGRSYFNIHTTFRPGGEIRGFLQVPEPSGFLLAGLALAALTLSSRKRAASR